MADKRPCFYCLEPDTSIAVCLDCRSKFERAQADAKRYKGEAEGWRRSYWKLMNEKMRDLKRPKGKR